MFWIFVALASRPAIIDIFAPASQPASVGVDLDALMLPHEGARALTQRDVRKAGNDCKKM